MNKPATISCPAIAEKDLPQADAMPANLALSAPVLMQQGWLDAPEPDFLPAEIRLGWTPSRLIVFAEIPDRDIFTQATGPNQKMWELGDVFEMFLKPEDRTDYVELHVTPPNFRLQYQIESPGKPATELSDDVFSSRVKIDTANQKWTVYAEVPATLVSGRDQIASGEVLALLLQPLRRLARRPPSHPLLHIPTPSLKLPPPPRVGKNHLLLTARASARSFAQGRDGAPSPSDLRGASRFCIQQRRLRA